jgi:CHAT domain-containing protein
VRDALAKRAAAGERWAGVHFACHGLVEPENPVLSALALTPAPPDDGFLTAIEVVRLRIPSDIVVLSACETGLDRLGPGQGLVGLVRAFMFAGAPRVVATLWPVEDDSTGPVVETLYGEWRKGRPAAGALSSAVAAVRSSEPGRKDPRRWAAWVLWGLPD